MKFISFDDADHLLDWHRAADVLERGHRLAPAKIGDLLLRQGDNDLLNRAAWIEGFGMALKSMSVFPQNATHTPPLPSIQGGVLLFDGKDGSLKSIIDGTLVTKWKTAADSVLGARLLAPENPKTHLMIGAGTVAHSILQAYHTVFPSIEKFIIWNRTRKRADNLAKSVCHIAAEIVVEENLESAISSANLITSATMATEPVIMGEWVKPATHVDLIGAYRPDMREADDRLLQMSELFVDSRQTTIGHIGEIDIPLRSGAIKLADIRGDLYDLCNAKAARSSPESITVFKNGGGAHLDLMISTMIFEAMSNEKV